MKTVSKTALSLAVLLIALAGCGSNIKHIGAPETAVPDTQTFNSAFDSVWSATQRALADEGTVRILDKSSGIMATEFRTIDAKELSIAQTVFLGKTYKSSYTVNFTQTANRRTEVKINVKLQAVQVGFFGREESNANVEGYLRQKLFDKISANIRT